MAVIFWEVDHDTVDIYKRIIQDHHDATMQGDALRAARCEAELKELPGFPRGFDPTSDIVRVVNKRPERRLILSHNFKG
jgi:hypothetical protein